MTWPIDVPLHWLRPQWLWALLALPLIAWAWRRMSRRRDGWRAWVDPHLLAHLLDTRTPARAAGALWLGFVGYALAVGALAGPSWQQVAQPLWQTHAPLVVAIDLSSASLAGDMPPSRLAQARAKIARLLQARAGGQVALVAYADDAYTVAPLTDDAANVALLLDALSPDIMPGDGSDGGRAIAWCARLLRQSGFAQGDILLLTDHADAAARRAARDASQAGLRVSALGLGTDDGAVYRDREGGIGHARLDAGSLRALASAGGGQYASLTADDADLAALGVLDPQRGGALATRGGQTRLWQDQGYWLLLPLLAIAAFAFRRGGMLAALVLACALPWYPANAAEGWWRRPDQQAHARLDDGVQAYRRGQFDAAAQAWRGVPGAEAAYDLGNALAKRGDYAGAVAAYDRALRLRPGMQDAIANREAVRRAMRRKPSSSSGNGGQGRSGGAPQSNQDPQRQQQGPQRQGQGDSQPSRQSQQAQRQPSPSGRSQQSPPPSQSQSRQAAPASPADAQAQRRADAAQRARMRQALARAKASAQPKPRVHAETPAEREQRLADDAWLRRIPDDPGALLRAKFQLEHERRLQQGGHP